MCDYFYVLLPISLKNVFTPSNGRLMVLGYDSADSQNDHNSFVFVYNLAYISICIGTGGRLGTLHDTDDGDCNRVW